MERYLFPECLIVKSIIHSLFPYHIVISRKVPEADIVDAHWKNSAGVEARASYLCREQEQTQASGLCGRWSRPAISAVAGPSKGPPWEQAWITSGTAEQPLGALSNHRVDWNRGPNSTMRSKPLNLGSTNTWKKDHQRPTPTKLIRGKDQ